MHDKDVHYQNSITKPHTLSEAVGYDPQKQDHPIKNDPGSGSNLLSLNRDRLQKYWANTTFLKNIQALIVEYIIDQFLLKGVKKEL